MENGSTLFMGIRIGSFCYGEGGTFRVRSRLSFQLTFLLDWQASAMPHKTTTRSPSKKFIIIVLAPDDHLITAVSAVHTANAYAANLNEPFEVAG
jgi:hypothetical protein